MPHVILSLRLATYAEHPARFVLKVERSGSTQEYRCGSAEEVIGRAVAALFATLASRISL